MSIQGRFGANVGLIDARGTAQILRSLSCQFTAAEFADFCTVAEEIVLRDHIVVVGKLEQLPRPLHLALQPLFSDGLIVTPGEAFRIPELQSDSQRLSAVASAIKLGLTTTTVEDATYEARRLLGGEAHYGVVATPLLRQLQHFGIIRRPRIENTVWDLVAQYGKISNAAQDVRRRLQHAGDLPHISIPPIALTAIQRSKSFEQAIHEVFQLRRQLAPLRKHFAEIEERLREGKLSPAEAIELERTWRGRWNRMAEKLGSTGKMAVGRTSLSLLQDGIKIVQAAISPDAIDAVATTVGLILPAAEALGAMHLRPVHKSVSNYLSTNDQQLTRALAKIFDTDFVALDSDMRALAYARDNPWRLACGAIDRTIPENHEKRSPPRGTNHLNRLTGSARRG